MRSASSTASIMSDLPLNLSESEVLQDRSNAIRLLTGVLDALRGDEPASEPEADIWASGDVRIELRSWIVKRGTRQVSVTRKEFGILRMLVTADGAPVAREDLWRKGSEDLPESSRSLDSHIWSIRSKLEGDPAKPRHLQTVLRFGYRLS